MRCPCGVCVGQPAALEAGPRPEGDKLSDGPKRGWGQRPVLPAAEPLSGGSFPGEVWPSPGKRVAEAHGGQKQPRAVPWFAAGARAFLRLFQPGGV